MHIAHENEYKRVLHILWMLYETIGFIHSVCYCSIHSASACYSVGIYKAD